MPSDFHNIYLTSNLCDSAPPSDGNINVEIINIESTIVSNIQALSAITSSLLPLPRIIESSDITASISTNAILTVNSSASGTINFLRDHDWYKIVLQSGHTYSFAAIGTGLNSLIDPYLYLHDNSGAVIRYDSDSGAGKSAVIGKANVGGGVFTAPYSGEYFIDVAAQSNLYTGSYGVSVIESSVANGYKPGFDPYMGAGALHADATLGSPHDWNDVLGYTRGQGVSLSYSFRSSQTYSPGAGNTFSKCTSVQMDAIDKILGLFSEICNVTFVNTNPGGYSNAGRIVFANYYNNTAPEGAFAYFPATGQQAGDLWMNTADVNPSNVTPGTYSWITIAHELGHALGLSHPGDYNAGAGTPSYTNSAQFIQDSSQYTMMSYWAGSLTGQSPGIWATSFTPLLFDIYELQILYGINTATRSGDTTYGFNSTAGSLYYFDKSKAPYYCIWDGGGKNTIDASGYSQNQVISLTSGSFSDIGGGNSNISIALGVTIQSAIGGAGNDLLKANNYNDFLDGGSGNDTLVGGEGNDSLFGGVGNDSLVGGVGDDTLYDPFGNNIIDGGMGNDILFTNYAFGSGYKVEGAGSNFLMTGSLSSNVVLNVESVHFRSGNTVSVSSLWSSTLSVAIANQLFVSYLGRAGDVQSRAATAVSLNGEQPSVALQKNFYEHAVAEGIFSLNDNSMNLVNKIFYQIFSFGASDWEQRAWVNLVDSGVIAKEQLPWGMFVGYLGSTTVPDAYRVPCQSKLVAVDAYTNELLNNSSSNTALISSLSAIASAKKFVASIVDIPTAAVAISHVAISVADLSHSTSGPVNLSISDFSSESLYNSYNDLIVAENDGVWL